MVVSLRRGCAFKGSLVMKKSFLTKKKQARQSLETQEVQTVHVEPVLKESPTLWACICARLISFRAKVKMPGIEADAEFKYESKSSEGCCGKRQRD